MSVRDLSGRYLRLGTPLLAGAMLVMAGHAFGQTAGTPGSPGAPSGGAPSAQSPGASQGSEGRQAQTPATPGSPGATGTPSQPGSPGMAQPAQPGVGTIPERQATPGAPATPSPATPGTGMAASGVTGGFISELGTAHYLGSRLDGADVYNAANEKIADVEDVVISDQGRVVAVILSYGGVAGIGQTYVAVEPSQLRMRKVSDSETRVETSITMDQLRQAPKFSYSARAR